MTRASYRIHHAPSSQGVHYLDALVAQSHNASLAPRVLLLCGSLIAHLHVGSATAIASPRAGGAAVPHAVPKARTLASLRPQQASTALSSSVDLVKVLS